MILDCAVADDCMWVCEQIARDGREESLVLRVNQIIIQLRGDREVQTVFHDFGWERPDQKRPLISRVTLVPKRPLKWTQPEAVSRRTPSPSLNIHQPTNSS